MKKYLENIPVWMFCSMAFQINGALSQTDAFSKGFPIIILLLIIFIDDVVRRMIVVMTTDKKYSPIVAPLSMVIFVVYQRLLILNISIIQSEIFMNCFSAVLLFVFYLVIFPFMYCKK